MRVSIRHNKLFCFVIILIKIKIDKIFIKDETLIKVRDQRLWWEGGGGGGGRRRAKM